MVLMTLMWVLPHSVSAQTIKCDNGMSNLDDVQIRLGCGDWFDVGFEGHPGFTYTLSVDGIQLATFSGGNGEYSTGAAKSKFAPGDTITIVQTCDNSGGGKDSDIFRALLPPDLGAAGTWSFVPVGTAGTTNTQWFADDFTSTSPTDVPVLTIEGDNGRTWPPSCMGSTDGKWTFGASADADAAVYDDLDSLRYESKVGFTGSGTIPVTGTVTIEGLSAGSVSANIIAYSGSCTDTVMVMNVVREGSNEPTIACNDLIYVSVDATCMAELHPGMVLAGKSSNCVPTNMDSLVLKHANGQLLDPSNIRYQGDTLIVENAYDYIHGPELKVELHSTDGTVSNYCWGNIVVEDKLAPVLTCNDRKVVKCHDFDGTSTDGIEALDCDPEPTINIVNETIITDCREINPGGGPTTDSIFKRIIRTYTATDAWGNTTNNTCTDTLDIRRLDTDLTNGTLLDIHGLVRPLDYLKYNTASPLDTNAFVCDSRFPFADADNDHIPDPVPVSMGGAGVPSIKGTFDLHPSNWIDVHSNVAELLESCKTVVTYSDLILPRVGCVEKVVRTWTFREFVCGHERAFTFTQDIEIVDSIGPSFDVPEDQKVTTNLKTCERDMLIPAPTNIEDYCKKSEPTRTIVNAYNADGEPIGSLSTDDNTFSEAGGRMDLPVGRNKIQFQVFDDCHNFTIDSMFITVVDETPPVAICKEFLVVGIADEGESGLGEVWVEAHAFDNGSYDDCGIADRCVARMDDLNEFDRLETAGVGGTEDGDPHGRWYVPLDSINSACGRAFEASETVGGVEVIYREDLCTPQIMLCCEDVGNTVMVVFRATDKGGNYNECMVEIEAQDKRTPVIHCPPDLTIDCKFDFPMDATLNLFGDVVSQGQQEAIDIPSGYILESEAGKDLSDGVWFGNCSATVGVTVDTDINECRMGEIVRTFTVTSNNGNTAKCKQTIQISRERALKTEDIVFPADMFLEGCADPALLTPDSTGFPSVGEEECSLVGWAYEDLTVRFNNNDGDACFKIIREWTVIDWCKEPSFTIGTGTQVIKVNDSVAPVIGGNVDGECASVSRDVLDNDCEEGQIDLVQGASDDCTDPENLVWTVRIDAFNDGVYEITRTISGDTADVSDEYPIGTHRVQWEVRDQCGNIDVCEQLFSIRNIVEPTPICLTDITASLMPVDDGSGQNGQPDDDVADDGIADGGMLTVWAEEYNIGSSSHPCGYDLVYSFAADAVVASRDFTCADLTGSGSTVVDLDVHVLAVEKDIDGEVTEIISSDFCSVVLRLDDNNNTCDTTTFNPANVLITGNIRTESNENLPTVDVSLRTANNGASTAATTTDLGGMYAFGDMPLGGSYRVVPRLNADLLNGVSTLDLVLIQKHILGLDQLGSPYKIIAADVNNDKSISAIDLIELRKAILGLSVEFTNNDSWRFVDETYEFQKPTNPLNEVFGESYRIQQLESNMIIDFIGVKVGDVNENVNVSGLLTAPRSKATVLAQNTSFTVGDNVRVPVSFENISEVLGYQFTLEFDTEAVSFSGYESGAIDVSAENFGINRLVDGIITTSWADVEAASIAGETAFVLEFTAKRNGEISDVLEISSAITTAEVYNANAETSGLVLEFSEIAEGITEGYELFQNTPNPFGESTSIGFMLAKDADATISIFDVTGKLVNSYSGSFNKGLNTITVSKSDLNATGVLYYTLDTKEFTSTRRMVLIE